MTKVRSRIFL